MSRNIYLKSALLVGGLLLASFAFLQDDLSSDAAVTVKSVKETKIFYNDAFNTDQEESYIPTVSELITYTNGDKMIKTESSLSVKCKKDEEAEAIHLQVISANDTYQVEVPVISVTSITTDTKVSTKKSLSADKLKLYLNYSDGSKVKIDSKELHSEVIEKPKVGENLLTCYYKEEKFQVKVTAYNPVPTVSFGKYGKYELSKNKAYHVEGATRLTQSMGVTQFNGHRETYYSQRVLPGTALDIPGRHVAEDGTVRDKDGYICVASDYGFMGKHEVLLTSLGPAKVYDTGCAFGTIDLYVNW